MTFFTDSPYERMMVQKPTSRREPPKQAAPPCEGCSCASNKPCVGVCCRNLLEQNGKKPGKAGAGNGEI